MKVLRSLVVSALFVLVFSISSYAQNVSACSNAEGYKEGSSYISNTGSCKLLYDAGVMTFYPTSVAGVSTGLNSSTFFNLYASGPYDHDNVSGECQIYVNQGDLLWAAAWGNDGAYAYASLSLEW